jgi:hypothetical protein
MLSLRALRRNPVHRSENIIERGGKSYPLWEIRNGQLSLFGRGCRTTYGWDAQRVVDAARFWERRYGNGEIITSVRIDTHVAYSLRRCEQLSDYRLLESEALWLDDPQKTIIGILLPRALMVENDRRIDLVIEDDFGHRSWQVRFYTNEGLCGGVR